MYVASCSLGEVAFNNRTHCILRMFPDSVSICHFVAPVESFKSFASCRAFFVCSQAAPSYFSYPGIVFCFSCVAVLRELAFNNRISVLLVPSLVHKPLRCICVLLVSSDVLYYVSATLARTKVVSFPWGSASSIVPHCSVQSCCSSLISSETGVIVTHSG